MPILYSAVGIDKTILFSYASCDGNFKEIAEKVFTREATENKKITYTHGRFLLHCIVENKYLYFCVTDNTCQRSRAFLFLNEVKRTFLKKYVDHKEDFTCVLVQEMYRYNEDYTTITMRQGDLDEINTIGVDTTESILGEKVLHIENDNNLKYTTISYVSKTPERVIISLEKSKLNIAIVTILIALSSVYLLKPSSFIFVIVFIIFLICIQR